MEIPEEAVLPAREREVRHRCGDAHVDPHVADARLVAELPGGGAGPSSDEPEPPLGLTVRDLDRAAIARYNVPPGLEGVVIFRINPTGAAFSLPLRRGFVITEINRRPVRSVAEYERVFASVKPGDVLALYFYDFNNAQRRLVTVTVER